MKVGDRVMLHDGGRAPVVWIGHRRVDCARHPNPKSVWPVRVAAHALGIGLPHRDLYSSPDHAVFVADVLIPMKYLINGTSIIQTEVAEVTYFHVQLPAHAVLLAESYLDTGGRCNFENGGGAIALHPDFSVRAWEALSCAPLIVTGAKLDDVRRAVDARVAGPKRREATVPARAASRSSNSVSRS